MNRLRRSTKDRARLFEAHNGICHLCGGKIQAGQAWEWSHPIPLAAGGADDLDNAAPAHAKCHKHQTSNFDAPLIAKVRRNNAKHIGAKPKRPWNTKWRKKMDGTVEPRT